MAQQKGDDMMRRKRQRVIGLMGVVGVALMSATLIATADSDICITAHRCKDDSGCSPCSDNYSMCGISTTGGGASACEDYRYVNYNMDGHDIANVFNIPCTVCTYFYFCEQTDDSCPSKPSWYTCREDDSQEYYLTGYSGWMQGGICEVK